MAKNTQPFVIDDMASTSDNIAAYGRMLESVDAPLATSIRMYLELLAAARPVDTAAIWDTLYAATAPTKQDLALSHGGPDGTEGSP